MNRALLQGLASGKVRPKGPVASAARSAQGYMDAVTPGAESVQDALVQLIGTDGAGLDTLRTNASRMAASPQMLALLQALPAAGAVGSTVALGDVLTGDDESFANKGMDLLGMGAGAMYGINRGPGGLGGSTLAGTTGAVLGKLGSDALQGIIGG